MPREPGYLDRADESYDAGRFEEAAALYQKHIEVEPDSPDGHQGLGLSLWGLERYAEALRALNTAQKLDPEGGDIAINRAALLTDHLERHQEAVAICDGLLRRRLKKADLRDARYFAAKAHFRLGNDSKALTLLDRALGDSPEDIELLSWQAHVFYESGHFEKAKKVHEQCLKVDAEDPGIHWDYGLVLEKLGLEAMARREFEKAHEQAPEDFLLPAAISPKDMERIARETLADLPEDFRDAIRDVPVIIDDFPSRAFVMENPTLGPQLLGLFTGNAHYEQSPVPTAILLFRKNLEKVVTDREELEDEIRKTLLHEIGHYLGLSEDDLQARGLA
ncbi:MAG: tetratricopeptide repeat protein [Verrucomicrobia bacterium]|nr:tetratricopeptide repeat protein [Verrucomicrobiota bacterium]